MEGRCKFYLPEKRFGFVAIEDERGREVADFFFHETDLIDDAPSKGDVVTFWIAEHPRRHNLVAVEVKTASDGERP